MTTLAELSAPGFDPYADVSGDTGWFGSDVVSGIGKAAKSVAKVATKHVAPFVAKQVVPLARTALKNSGPWGMAANGLISGVEAGLSGKNVGEVMLAAAQGAAPTGIDTALSAATRIAKGDKVLDVALSSGVEAFAPGSGERFAYSVAADALRKGASKADLGKARRALANEGQRRAFDAAVGTLARAANPKLTATPPVRGGMFKNLRGAIAKATGQGKTAVVRQQVAPGVVVKKVVKPIIPAKPRSPKSKPRPMTAKRPGLAVVKFDKPRQELNLNTKKVPRSRRPQWKRLSQRAAAFILGRVPLAPRMALLGRDTGALAGGLTASSMPTVRKGSSGAAVSTLQATLNEKRASGLVVDGKFGDKTLAAVKLFQTSAGLVVDGIVGPKTWNALDNAASLPVAIPSVPLLTSSTSVTRPTIRLGSRGASVSEAQTLLNSKNASNLKVDGIFGNLTLAATKSFQKSKGLVVDGVIGPKTWAALDAAPIKAPSVNLPAPILPVLTSPPVLSAPEIGDSAEDTNAIVQAKTLLIAWAKSDGIDEAGLSDYGARAEDLSTTFGSRDKFVCASFARWNNRTQGTSLNTDGALTPAVADALRLWAEKRAAVVFPGATPVLPSLPLPSTTPPVITSPTPGPIVLSPSPGPIVPSVPSLPTIPTVPTVPTTTPNTPAKSDNSLLAGGGVVGAVAGYYLMGGLMGGLMGAAAGALAGSVVK